MFAGDDFTKEQHRQLLEIVTDVSNTPVEKLCAAACKFLEYMLIMEIARQEKEEK